MVDSLKYLPGIALICLCSTAFAQEESIKDPLSNSTNPSTNPSTPTEEVIVDPTSHSTSAPQSYSSTPNHDALENTEFHLELFTSINIDTAWKRDSVSPSLSEDVVSSNTRATFSVAGGSFQSMRYKLDVRLSVRAQGKKPDASDTAILDRTSYIYEALPLAAYVEFPIGNTLRVRLGDQVISWAKLDIAPASDVLHRQDFRPGPTSISNPAHLPTLSARGDWTLSNTIDFSFGWTPFVEPHRFDWVGTDYAIVSANTLSRYPTLRSYIEQATGYVDATTLIQTQAGFSTFSFPDSKFDGGEFAVRANAHYRSADFGLTYGNVYSKIPIASVNPAVRQYVTNPNSTTAAAVSDMLRNERPLIDSTYPRYHQLALDFEAPLDSFTVAWELGYSPSRQVNVIDEAGFPSIVETPVLQSGFRAQYTPNEKLTFSTEVDAIALTDVPEPNQTYLALDNQHVALVGLLVAQRTFDKHTFTTTLLAISSGPSFGTFPQYRFEWTDNVEFGINAYFFPDIQNSPTNQLTLADVLSNQDSIELNLRYRM